MCAHVLFLQVQSHFVIVIGVPIKDYPIGFILNTKNRTYQCNPKLAVALTGRICRIPDEKIKPSLYNWLSLAWL